MAYQISHQGYVPTLSSAAQASVEKGRQERAAKVAPQPSTQVAASQNTGTSTSTKNTGGASAASSSTTVSISNEARTQLAAEKPGAQAAKSSPVKFGSVEEAIAYGTRKANEQAAAKNKAMQSTGSTGARATSTPGTQVV